MNEEKEEIKNLCIEGLRTDGGHHKQWYLEEILMELGYTLKEIRKELFEEDDCNYNNWEEGISP